MDGAPVGVWDELDVVLGEALRTSDVSEESGNAHPSYLTYPRLDEIG